MHTFTQVILIQIYTKLAGRWQVIFVQRLSFLDVFFLVSGSLDLSHYTSGRDTEFGKTLPRDRVSPFQGKPFDHHCSHLSVRPPFTSSGIPTLTVILFSPRPTIYSSVEIRSLPSSDDQISFTFQKETFRIISSSLPTCIHFIRQEYRCFEKITSITRILRRVYSFTRQNLIRNERRCIRPECKDSCL